MCVCLEKVSCLSKVDVSCSSGCILSGIKIVCFGLQEIREHRVLECKFFHTLEGSSGFAVMTNKYQFFVVADSDRPKDDIRVKKLADVPCKLLAVTLIRSNFILTVSIVLCMCFAMLCVFVYL